MERPRIRALVNASEAGWAQSLNREVFRRQPKAARTILFLIVAASTNWLATSISLPAEAQKQHHPSHSAGAEDQQPAPQPISYAEASTGQYQDSLISISGVLVSQLHDADSDILIINADGHLISGYIEKTPLDDYQLGSRLRIAGYCRIMPESASQAARHFHLEMRNAADIELIAKPSWYTAEHLWEILTVVFVIAIVFAVRAYFVRWRDAHEKAWIDRSTSIAKERSRVLQMISSNSTLDELLQEICTSTAQLLPGAECAYSLQFEGDVLDPISAEQPAISGSKPLFELALRDAEDQVIGKITVTSPTGRKLAADSEEIYRVLSELAALAIRQSLLYKGLVHHSTHDPLTELPNRRLCESRLASALAEAELNGGQLAVIYIDINRFKYVNDQFGHKTGDLYLRQISARLRAQLRPIDMLARVGGDEFVVVAPFPEGFDRAHALTTRLQACFKDPFSLDGVSIDGSASFGFARYPEHGLTAEELTRHADREMYIAKQQAHISQEPQGMAIITPYELELALLNRAFRLAYQPQFSVDGRLTGMEMLIRLDDPVLGIITPDAFISVAERHPIIVDIGAWALRTAIQDAIRWELHRGEAVLLAINVSVRQLEEPGYARSVLACLKEYAFPPERLEIELIERSLMFSGDKVLQQLVQLHEAGVRISLDDFGTEQSCLSALHKLPIDTIKLDRSFIRAMDDEPTVIPIIQAIVSMAHSLGKRIVAEAIEHVGPVPALLKMGKMDFQGYLLSRPVPAAEVQPLIQGWRSGIVMPEAFREPNHGNTKHIHGVSRYPLELLDPSEKSA